MKRIIDVRGKLSAIEGTRDIPFEIRRVYYMWDVPKEAERGGHAHRRLHQILLCLNGSVTIDVITGSQTQVYILDQPDVGLYIGPMAWRNMKRFSEKAVLLVLASEYYDESDYIRDFIQYRDESVGLFG